MTDKIKGLDDGVAFGLSDKANRLLEQAGQKTVGKLCELVGKL